MNEQDMRDIVRDIMIDWIDRNYPSDLDMDLNLVRRIVAFVTALVLDAQELQRRRDAILVDAIVELAVTNSVSRMMEKVRLVCRN